MTVKYLLFFIIIFIHFTIAKIGDFEITIGYSLILISPVFFFSKIRISKGAFFCYFLYLFYEIFKVAFENELNISIVEFVKSQLQIFLLIVFISIYTNSQLRKNSHINLDVFLRKLGILILISIFFQAISFYFFGDILSNYFGVFQWKYNLFSENFRAKSFFLEPSYLALVLNVLLFSDFILKGKRYLVDSYRICILLGIIASGSLFGLLLFVVVYIVYTKLFLNTKSNKYYFFLILPLLFLLFYLGLFNRLNELAVANTSGYERVIFPVLLLWFMLSNLKFYFGIPISGDLNLSNLASGEIFVLNETVQNAFFLIIMNLGVLFIPLFIYYIIRLRSSKDTANKFFLILLPIFLFNSGGLYAFYYAFFTILFPIYILKIRHINENFTHKY